MVNVTQFRPEITTGHWKMTGIKLALSGRSSYIENIVFMTLTF